MFHQFYDNNLHSFLLGKIESYKTKSLSNKCHCLILNLDGREQILEYTKFSNMVSDIESLHNALNDYYLMVMENERGGRDNVMGYDTCGDGIGTECPADDEDSDEYEEDRKRPMGFRPNIVKC